MIYFVQRVSDRAIKIGTTTRLSQRLVELRSAVGKCEVLAVMDGSYADEAVLHRRFRFCCVAGEWFSDAMSLFKFIEEEGGPWDGEDEVPSTAVAITCTSTYKAWLTEFAEAQRMNGSQLIDQALAEWAAKRGYRQPPKR